MAEGGGPFGALALSSMYAQRWPDRSTLAPFFALGHALGFERFELSHDVGPAALAAVDPGRDRIAAVHHPCPAAPPSVAGALVAADDAARAAAVAALRASVRTAARLGAPVVVLHLGRVPDDHAEAVRRLAFEVTNRFRAGQRRAERYETARAALAALVAEREPAALERGAASLRAVVAEAGELGVGLAVETGYHPDELPTPAGLAALLDDLDDAGIVGAWLDTGHVGARAALGFATPDDWRAAAAGRWLGTHVHDLVGLRDHLAPGSGSLDLGALLAMVPPGATRTLEVDWHLAPEEVAEGARHVQAIRGAEPAE